MTVSLADEISATEMEKNNNILQRGPPFIRELPVGRHTSIRKKYLYLEPEKEDCRIKVHKVFLINCWHRKLAGNFASLCDNHSNSKK
jgi:hypothetical protein